MNAGFKIACRLVVGAVFIAAGGLKLTHPQAFFSDLLSFHVAGPEMAWRLTAAFLPWLELLSGAGLILNIWPETIRPVVSMLCLIFVLMLAQAVLRGLELNCGCFGSGGDGWFARPAVALVRAGLLLAAAVYIAIDSPPPKSTGATSRTTANARLDAD